MKLNKLLSISTIASVAVIATPLVTSCKSSMQSFDLNTNSTLFFWGENDCLITEKTHNISKETWYEANIAVSCFDSFDDDYGTWRFGISNTLDSEDEETGMMAPIAKIDVWVDGVKQTQVAYSSGLLKNQIATMSDGRISFMDGGKETLKTNLEIKIQFKTEISLDNAYLLFYLPYR